MVYLLQPITEKTFNVPNYWKKIFLVEVSATNNTISKNGEVSRKLEQCLMLTEYEPKYSRPIAHRQNTSIKRRTVRKGKSIPWINFYEKKGKTKKARQKYWLDVEMLTFLISRTLCSRPSFPFPYLVAKLVHPKCMRIR